MNFATVGARKGPFFMRDNRLLVSEAARLIRCHVSYVHKLIRESPGLLGEQRRAPRLWTLDRSRVLAVAKVVAANKKKRSRDVDWR